MNPPSAEYSSIGPGIAGFLVIFGLALATVLLIRSMVGHLRKVRYGQGPEGEPGPDADGRPSVDAGPDADSGPEVPRDPSPGPGRDHGPDRDAGPAGHMSTNAEGHPRGGRDAPADPARTRPASPPA